MMWKFLTEFLCWTFVLMWTGLKSDSCDLFFLILRLQHENPCKWMYSIRTGSTFGCILFCDFNREWVMVGWVKKKWNACLRAAWETSHAAVENSNVNDYCMPGAFYVKVLTSELIFSSSSSLNACEVCRDACLLLVKYDYYQFVHANKNIVY